MRGLIYEFDQNCIISGLKSNFINMLIKLPIVLMRGLIYEFDQNCTISGLKSNFINMLIKLLRCRPQVYDR